MGPCWLSILAPRRLQQCLHIINGWGSLCLLFSSLSKRFVKGSLLSLCNYVSERKVIFRLTDLENCWGERWREGMVREFGMDMYTLLYLKWKTNSRITYYIAQGALFNVMWQPGWEGRVGENGYMDIMAESFCRLLETITTLLISYTPV